VVKILAGILTSRETDDIVRAIKSAQHRDVSIVVIVNTNDNELYESVKTKVAELKVVDVVKTQSNGNPGKGKNSVISYFKKTDYTHLIPIDGDDYLAKDGIKYLVKYIKILEPDVVGQGNNKMSIGDLNTTWEDFGQNIVDPKYNWSDLEEVSKKTILSLVKIRNLSDTILPFNRFLILSKTAITKFKYCEDIKIADDITAYLQLYAQTVKGIKYYITKTRELYVYDLTDQGVLHQYVSGEHHKDMQTFFDKVGELNFDGAAVTYID